METNARYTLIGSFTLAVIGIGFAFVYWLHAGGGLGQRSTYRIRYDSSVSGLLKGSAVLFNGIRVGEVTALGLDPESPEDVTVEIAVARYTPVRADTRIAIDFQGLTGAPVVTLAGGSSRLPLLEPGKGNLPILVAEKNAGRGITQAARDVLRNFDRVVTENSEPLRNLIANIDKFSGALARNSDKVDGLMAGLERLTGGAAKQPAQIYELKPATSFPLSGQPPKVVLVISEATTLSMFDTDRIVVRGGANGKPVLDDAQWPDLLPKVVQARLLQSFENAQFAGVVSRAPEGLKVDFQLVVDIRNFNISAESRSVEVKLAARVFSSEGRLVATRIFQSNSQISSLDAPVAATALSTAFERVASDIVLWTFSVI